MGISQKLSYKQLEKKNLEMSLLIRKMLIKSTMGPLTCLPEWLKLKTGDTWVGEGMEPWNSGLLLLRMEISATLENREAVFTEAERTRTS